MRRTISHTPSPISSSGQVNSKMRPPKIIQLPEQEQQPEADQHDGADRLLAPPVSLAEAAERMGAPGSGIAGHRR